MIDIFSIAMLMHSGPGINDNGSGTNSLFEIAMQLPKFSVKNAVRFGWYEKIPTIQVGD